MPTLQLPCTNGNFLSYVFNTTAQTGLSRYPTCAGFLKVANSDAESNKNYQTNRDNLDVHTSHVDWGGSILEFTFNPLLNYKKVNSIRLHYNINVDSAPNTADGFPPSVYLARFTYLNNYYNYWWEYVGRYNTNYQLNEITNTTFRTRGSFTGSWRNLHDDIPANVATYDIEKDISSLYDLNNLPDKIRLIISAGQSMGSMSDPVLGHWMFDNAEVYYSEPSPTDASRYQYIDPDSTYIVVDYSDITPSVPTPLSPVNMGLNPNRDITFSWQYNSATPATQTSATIQYRVRGSGTWTTLTSSGSGTSKVLVGGLAAGQYEWRVCTTNSLSETSAYSAVQYFNVVAQLAPTAVYPGSGLTLMEGQDVTFTWIYNSLTPATQASATLKYKLKSAGAWTNFASNNSNPYCTIQNLPQGNYEWKVSIINNFGETSPDSNALEFNIIGRPQPPIIATPANCCLTTISWNASGQESAEIMLYKGDDELLVHETIATAVTSYKPQMFLKGTYKVKVRIKNNSDLWSDFRELTFTINAAGPTKGTLIATPLEDRVALNGTHSSTNVALVRIEDGEETIIAMSDSAVDDTVAGNTVYTYVVRSWNTGGYTDSDIKVVECDFIGSIIKGDSGELHLDKSDTVYIPHEETFSGDYAALKFVGREYPIVETDNFTNNELAKRFHVTREQSKVLNKLAKEKSVFYRDNHGNAYKAKITGLKYSNYLDTGYLVEMSFIRTAPSEVIINV